METGDVIYEKVYMSPRPPPKISLKHDWKRELGSEDAQRPDGQVVQQFKSSQSNQPTPNPDHDRTGQPVASSGRKTSRSQEIDVNSFHDETVSLERTGRPVVETSVIQARSSEDSKDPDVGTAHERTRRLVVETNTENVPDSSQTHSCHESETFNVGDKTLRERTGQNVVETGTPQTRSSDDSKSFNVEDKTAHDRTGKPVVCRDTSRARSRAINVKRG